MKKIGPLLFVVIPLSMLLGGLVTYVSVRYLDAVNPLGVAPTLTGVNPAHAVDGTNNTPKRAPVVPRADLAATEKTTIAIFESASPSVVFITNMGLSRDLFRRSVTTYAQGSGSGFVWDKEGHIVTNFHVIRGAKSLRVTLADQTVWPAKVVGQYPAKDLAVLKINARGTLRPLPPGTSKDLIVGQSVFAIGNPFGLDHTLSTGVISGLGREIMSITKRPIQGVIQTDAAINPGNSGGPLLDSAGRLIGVNTAIYSPSGASAGVGFAVPADTVLDVVPQLIATGRVLRPALGIEIDDGSIAQRWRIKGIVVLGVGKGTGAESAGLRPPSVDRFGQTFIGDVDIITEVDGKEVSNSVDLYRILDLKKAGDKVRVKVMRNKKAREVEVELSAVPG